MEISAKDINEMLLNNNNISFGVIKFWVENCNVNLLEKIPNKYGEIDSNSRNIISHIRNPELFEKVFNKYIKDPDLIDADICRYISTENKELLKKYVELGVKINKFTPKSSLNLYNQFPDDVEMWDFLLKNKAQFSANVNPYFDTDSIPILNLLMRHNIPFINHMNNDNNEDALILDNMKKIPKIKTIKFLMENGLSFENKTKENINLLLRRYNNSHEDVRNLIDVLIELDPNINEIIDDQPYYFSDETLFKICLEKWLPKIDLSLRDVYGNNYLLEKIREDGSDNILEFLEEKVTLLESENGQNILFCYSFYDFILDSGLSLEKLIKNGLDINRIDENDDHYFDYILNNEIGSIHRIIKVIPLLIDNGLDLNKNMKNSSVGEAIIKVIQDEKESHELDFFFDYFIINYTNQQKKIIEQAIDTNNENNNEMLRKRI